MKRSWTPAALMGCLTVGYLVGSASRGPQVERLPAGSAPPAVSAIAPPPAHPVDPPASQAPSAPFPMPAEDDGLGEYPAWDGADLDCKDVDGPVRVTGPDPHRLDQDGNGIGCEG